MKSAPEDNSREKATGTRRRSNYSPVKVFIKWRSIPVAIIRTCS